MPKRSAIPAPSNSDDGLLVALIFRQSIAALLAGGLFLSGALFSRVCRADEPVKAAAGKASGSDVALPAETKAALDAAGLRVTGGNLALADDLALSKMLREAVKLRNDLVAAERDLKTVESEGEETKKQVTALKVKHVELSAALTGASNAIENNQIVGAMNAVAGQVDLLLQKQKDATEQLKKARAKASEAREAYVGEVLNMRAAADGVVQKWDKLSADPALQQAVTAANKATGSKLKLSPSPAFVTAEKKLQTLEHSVLSEAIPLVHEDGGMWVNVVIDTKHTRKMVVDSGATTISLPFAMAKELGLEPTSQSEKVVVGLADGSQVPATRMSIGSVRVGKFVVEDVDCIVLDRGAVNAPALLGMSFLGNFKFEVDKQKSELRMTKVDAGDVAAKPKASSSAAAKKKK